MHRLLVAAHALLALTALLPVYRPLYYWFRPAVRIDLPWRDYSDPDWFDRIPLEEPLLYFQHAGVLPSVLAAGLPAFLALINLPWLIFRRGEVARRWASYSSFALGLISATLWIQLLLRYGDSRAWGAWISGVLALLLLIAGTAAVARLRPPEPEAAAT